MRIRTHGRACAFFGRAQVVHTGVHLEKHRLTAVPYWRTVVRLVLQQSTARKMHKWPTKSHSFTITLQTHVNHIPNNTIRASTCTCIINHGIYHGNTFSLFLKLYIHTCKLQGWKSINQINMQSHINLPHIHQHAIPSSMASTLIKQARKTQEEVRNTYLSPCFETKLQITNLLAL